MRELHTLLKQGDWEKKDHRVTSWLAKLNTFRQVWWDVEIQIKVVHILF